MANVELTTSEELADSFRRRGVAWRPMPSVAPVRENLSWLSLQSNLVISRASGDPLGLERSARLARTAGGDELTFAIHLTPGAAIEHDDQAFVMAAGEGVFFSSSRAMRMRVGAYDQLMLQVDRRQLYEATGVHVPLGTRVPGGNLGLSTIATMIPRLVTDGESMPVEEREHYGRAMLDLLAGVVLAAHSGRPVTPSGPDALLERLKADILARLDDPELGPANLAARHSISLRYVHQLFGADAPAAYMRRNRLQAAAELLTRDVHRHLGVATVARRCGFQDGSTFVRAFRRHYGTSPTQYRELAAAADGNDQPRSVNG